MYDLKRPRELNSSDTEFSSPPKKKSCRNREHVSDLEQVLRRRVANSADHDALLELKGINNGDQNMMYAVLAIIDHVKTAVKERVEKEGKQILEVELYLSWLEGFDFVLDAVESGLNAKLPGTGRRVPGLGRVSFAILYHLLEEYINEVNAHQDGWSFRYPAGPVEGDPLIMSFAEEANDSTTDQRSDDAVRRAEEILERYDRVMESSVGRYKSECNKRLMAGAIGRKEESLARGCCLLSEQTGYGGTDDMGFNLLVKTRDIMIEWKHEGGSGENDDWR